MFGCGEQIAGPMEVGREDPSPEFLYGCSTPAERRVAVDVTPRASPWRPWISRCCTGTWATDFTAKAGPRP